MEKDNSKITEEGGIIKANFDEAKQSQLACVELLVNMGHEYVPREEVMRMRNNDTSRFVLKEVAYNKLRQINKYEYNGEWYDFTDKNIVNAVDELDNIQLEGLLDTSREVFNTIMRTGGKTVVEYVNGKGISQNLQFIDFQNPENNLFQVTVEFEASGKGDIRPDIVCFVNGIPFVIIENKKSSVSVKEAIEQMNRNQGPEKCPKLFTYPQLLIATNSKELLYGTTGTPTKFYTAWKEKGLPVSDVKSKKQKELDEKVRGQVDEEIKNLIATPINENIYKQICYDLGGSTVGHEQVLDRLPTDQDKGVYNLLKPDRLLDLTANYIVYESGVKIVSRYQQYFAIQKMLSKIKEEEETKTGIRRKGGIIWHTQGSGKSLTMVMFAKALIEETNIENPRIIIVTDRKDLNKQIADTFRACNLKKDVVSAKSGRHLLKLIENKDQRVITTLVHKFEKAREKQGELQDLDKNVFVLIDEIQRSQGGLMNLEMEKTIPNACFIGFTGTPLLKDDKSRKKFGDFIDKYTIDDALQDGVILPLVYEGRYVPGNENKKKIDIHSERVTYGLDEEKKKEVFNSVSERNIKDNPNRIKEIAYDVESHYLENFKGTGLKGQLVAPSKFAAVLFQKILEESGKIKAATVISDIGIGEDEESDRKKEVRDFLNEIKNNYQNLDSYERNIIDSFKNNSEGIEIIIVVDKLLTGFDAPRDTVLYLAKDLRDHNLLQAIARVNRLFEKGDIPKTSGFIIDYSENAQNLDTAMKLFGNYDEEDVQNTLIDVNEKIKELENSYHDLHEMFKDLKNSADDEAYIQKLNDEAERELFYKKINEFVKNFNECLVLKDFVKEFKHAETYKKELKKFMELRNSTRLRYADKVDLTEYKNKLIKILDQYVDADEVEVMTKQININDPEALSQAVEKLDSNESKAEAIAAQTQKTISEKAEKDPEFYDKFSKKIEDILEKMRQKKMEDVEALKQFKKIHEQVVNKEDESIPEEIRREKGADIFYRNLGSYFEDKNISDEEYNRIILDVLDILKQEAIVDWYRNNEVKRVIFNKIDDYIYDNVVSGREVELSNEKIKEMADKIIELATINYDQI
jgi:type I restriction enzyme R subunit